MKTIPPQRHQLKRLRISDFLSLDFDWTTFRLTEVAFGDTIISIPANSQHFVTTRSMTYNGKSFNVLIELGLRQATGEIFAVFQSLDPDTELPPDVLTGFLPPEPAHLSDPVADLSVPGRGRGLGHFSYTVQPKVTLTTGTEIRNVAQISFDGQLFISTDQIDPHDPTLGIDPKKQARITIDAESPTAIVTKLPPILTTDKIQVAWTGSDGAGSGVAGYDVYFSDNNGDYVPLLINTSLTTTTMTGVHGHTYRFYATAHDNVGQYEVGIQSAEAATTLQLFQPEISVSDAVTDVADDTGVVDFGKVLPGSASVVKTFTVRNTGTTNLVLQPITVTGTGFSLASANFSSGQIVGPDASVHVSG